MLTWCLSSKIAPNSTCVVTRKKLMQVATQHRPSRTLIIGTWRQRPVIDARNIRPHNDETSKMETHGGRTRENCELQLHQLLVSCVACARICDQTDSHANVKLSG